MPKINVHGLEMYYEIDGSGVPIVFISGLSQDHTAWVMQVPALVAAGFRVLTFDSRDAGQTAKSPTSYGIKQFADDTVGLMDAVGLSSAHIVGASMGGMIAQEIALNHSNRVASLTLVCTVAAVDAEMASVLRAWKASCPHVAADDFVLSLSAWLFTQRFSQQVEAIRGFMQIVRGNPFPQSVEGFQRQCDAVLGHNTADRLSRITAPTHVIIGAEDILTPPRHSRALAAAISGAHLTEVPAAAHVLALERPEDFNGALLGFLLAQPTATP